MSGNLSPRTLRQLRVMELEPPDSSSSEELYDDGEMNVTQRHLTDGTAVRTFRTNGLNMLRLLESQIECSDDNSVYDIQDILYSIIDAAVDIAESAEKIANSCESEKLDEDLKRLIEKIKAKGDMTDEQFQELVKQTLEGNAEPAKETDGGNKRKKTRKSKRNRSSNRVRKNKNRKRSIKKR